MKTLIILLSLFIFNQFDANAQENKILEKNLRSDIVKSDLSDGSFLSRAHKLIYKNGKLYMSETNRQQIIVFDENLNLLNTIARQGKGPKEVGFIANFSVNGDIVSVDDDLRIQNYKSGGAYIKSVNIQGISTEINLFHNFLYSNDILTIASKKDSALVRYDFSSGKPSLINEFGKRYKFPTLNQNMYWNNRYVDIIYDNIVAISDCQPFIELYNTDGKLLNKYDFSSIPIIEKEVKHINSRPVVKNMITMIAAGYSIHGNDLYILFNTQIPSYRCNKIIKFSLDGNKFTPEVIYTLPGSVYSGMAVGGKYLYAFNYHTSSICRFEL